MSRSEFAANNALAAAAAAQSEALSKLGVKRPSVAPKRQAQRGLFARVLAFFR